MLKNTNFSPPTLDSFNHIVVTKRVLFEMSRFSKLTFKIHLNVKFPACNIELSFHKDKTFQ